jgi:hypothetical protein
MVSRTLILDHLNVVVNVHTGAQTISAILKFSRGGTLI